MDLELANAHVGHLSNNLKLIIIVYAQLMNTRSSARGKWKNFCTELKMLNIKYRNFID